MRDFLVNIHISRAFNRRARCRSILLFVALLFARPLLAGRDVSEVHAGDVAGQGAPVIASNGGRFLQLWFISGQLYGSPSELTYFPTIPVAPFANGNVVALTAAGDGYLAIWNQQFGHPVIATLTLGAAVTRQAPLDVERLTAPQVAFNGKHLAVVDVSAHDAAAATDLSIYEPGGALVRRVSLPFAKRWAYAVTAIPGGDFAVVVAGASGVNQWRVADDGTIVSKIEIEPPPYPADASYAVSIALKNGRTFIVWVHFQPPTATTINTATLQPDGTVTHNRLLDHGVAPDGNVALVPVDLGFLLIFNTQQLPPGRNGIVALKLDQNGAPFDDHQWLIGFGLFSSAASSGNTIRVADVPGSYDLPSNQTGQILTFTPSGLAYEGYGASVTTPVHQTSPALTANGTGFTAAWLEKEGSSTRVMAGRVNPAGKPLDGAGIALGPASSPPVIAHGSAQDLAVWIGNGHLQASRLSSAGIAFDATPIDLAPIGSGTYDVAWNGSRYLVVWSNGVDLLASFVGIDGVATAPQPLGQRSPFNLIGDLDVAWDGSQFMLAYAESSFAGCDCPTFPDHIRLLRISAGGAPIDRVPPRVPGVHFRAHVAGSGSEWLVVLESSFDTSSIIVREEGGLLQLDNEVPIVHWFRGVGGAVAWDGSSYVVASQYNPSPTETGWLAAAQVSRFGVLLRMLVASLAGPPDFTTFWSPSAAADVAGNTGFAVSEMAPPYFISRARLYLLQDFSPMPSPPPAPHDAVSYFGGATARIDWQSEGSGNGFVLERSVDFGKSWYPDLSTVVSAGTRSIIVNASVGNQFRVRAFGPGGLSEGSVTSIGSMPRRRAKR